MDQAAHNQFAARSPRVAVVGATGAVGREFLTLFTERSFSCGGGLDLLASSRSAGSTLECLGATHTVRELTKDSFQGVDIAFFAAGGGCSLEYAPIAAKAGAVVIDNSSAFRMDTGTPLVVPEVNFEALAHEGSGGRIIANPNCSTILLLVAMEPLRCAFGVERICCATYQAVSGAGAGGMDALKQQARAALQGRQADTSFFPEPCAFNVFSHNSPTDPATGRNVEEQKMIDETRKIWSDPAVRVTATCIRVPVMRAHAEAVNVTLKAPATEQEVRDALHGAAGLEVVDDRAEGTFPTSLKASGRDSILVGRVRPDESMPSEPRGAETAYSAFDLFLAGDQIRKGAALNAVQIAECLLNGS